MPESSVLLGFDFGMKRIGVAVGQTITKTASPLDTLKAQDGIPDWNIINELIQKWRATAFVVGIPLNMDGTEQDITKAARKFANRLHGRFNMPVHFVDERLSTIEARTRIFEQGGYKALQEKQIDSIAAVIILEDWLQNI